MCCHLNRSLNFRLHPPLILVLVRRRRRRDPDLRDISEVACTEIGVEAVIRRTNIDPLIGGGGIRPGIEPIDALDSCCFNHDDCYETHNCGIARIIFSLMCRLCDCALARCAMSVDCNQSPFPDTCRRAQGRIGFLRARCYGL